MKLKFDRKIIAIIKLLVFKELPPFESSGYVPGSSQARALRKLIGSFNDNTKELSSDLLIVLQHVNETPNFKDNIQYEAKCLRENLSKFETVLVAFVYIRIFEITTPVSDYMQTPGLDVLQAWRMINEATDKLSKVARDFAAIYQHATTFLNGVNDKLFEEGIHLTTATYPKFVQLEKQLTYKVLKRILR